VRGSHFGQHEARLTLADLAGPEREDGRAHGP
jgi:hypothetical protein